MQLDDWLGKTDEPVLTGIEMIVDPLTVRQVLREAIHRSGVSSWSELSITTRRLEIGKPLESHLTWEDCCPEDVPLQVQIMRDLDKIESLLEPVPVHDKERSSIAALRDFVKRKEALGDFKDKTPTRYVYHDGAKDTRSGLLACRDHVARLGARGWIPVRGGDNISDGKCEVCEVGVDRAIRDAKGYRQPPDSGGEKKKEEG